MIFQYKDKCIVLFENHIAFTTIMASIILNDDIVLTETQIDRLPVFAAMIQDMSIDTHNEPINVIVPDGMSAPDIFKYASCKEDNDYVLPGSHTDVARRTLDWCGVDVGDLRTPRELHEELQDKTVQLEKQKTAMSDVAYLDYVEFVCPGPSRTSFFLANNFDFTKFAKCKFNVKNMDELVTSWRTDAKAPVLLTEVYWDQKMHNHHDKSIIAMQHYTHFGTVPDELYKVISVIRNMHGLQPCNSCKCIHASQ